MSRETTQDAYILIKTHQNSGSTINNGINQTLTTNYIKILCHTITIVSNNSILRCIYIAHKLKFFFNL